ncbi:MAG: agmatinase [Chloroflexota bacterium]|nr:agmatinase [Chloroflexota bacterium]
MNQQGRYLTTAPLVTLAAPGQRANVQLIGVPFDGTSTYRTGSRFGPDAVRAAFWNIEVYSQPLDIDLEELSLDDRGNVRHTARVDEMLTMAEATTRESVDAGYAPAILGGEHSITFGTFSAMPERTALLVFDAHFDLRDEYDDLSMMHATYLRRLIERRPGLRVIHVGARAATKEEWRFAAASGVTVITADQVHEENGALERFKTALDGVEGIYVSIDLDGLDPAYAPGVSNPEAAGISSRQLLQCLYQLRDTPIRGFDIVELCPQYDPSGVTAVAAAKFLAELCGLVHLQRAST